MKRANWSIPAVMLLGLFCPSALAQPSAQYQKAMQQYKEGHFKQAAADLCQVALQEPSKQIYHYLLANCLVHIEQHARAAEEYKVGYVLDPGSSTGEFCRQALLAYKKPIPQVTVSKNAGAAVADETELGRVKSLIQKQASFEKNKHDSLANRTAQGIKSQLDEEIRRIDLQMQADIQKLSEPLIFNPGPRANPLLANPELLKEKEDQIRMAAQIERDRVRKELTERSKPIESWRKDRSALLDEAAGNLQTQLDQPMGPSGVKLQAHGTGLYVRYYGKAGPNKYPDPHNATVRIGEAQTFSSSSNEADTVNKSPALKEPSREVKGSILPEAAKSGSYKTLELL